MAYLKSLKQDVSALKEQFPENHERFRISQTTSDQLTCRFIGENGKNYDIHAVIPVSFPFYLHFLHIFMNGLSKFSV